MDERDFLRIAVYVILAWHFFEFGRWLGNVWV